MTKPKNKFCIITTQRSGSAWLVSLLNSHPQIKTFYEIFLDRWAGDEHLTSFQNYDKSHFGVRPEITWRYLQQLETYPGEHDTIGFKIMYNQLGRHPEVLGKFARDGYKLIHLVRENHLDLLVSSASMEQNGLIHSKKEVNANAVVIDTESLRKVLATQAAYLGFMRKMLKVLPNPVMEITYSDLAQNNSETLQQIIDFLGVPLGKHRFESDRKKINRGTYQEKIANYEAVAQTLAGTRYERFLYS